MSDTVLLLRIQARDNLELSFVNEADMVFTTLSSTGRRVFERMKNAFDTVLIDEAAQASEVAVLQPLSFGCKRCVHLSLASRCHPWFMQPLTFRHAGQKT